MRLTAKQVTWLKVSLHLAGLLPFLWLVWAINHGGLGADPVKDIQHFTGRTALKFLLATLLITPLARYAKQPLLIRTRRLLGLWCFALMNPLMILVKIIKLRWIHILSYDQMVSRKINNQTTRCANSI
ncbi:hypothetical protein G7N13_10800, partial [Escherichia coli]|nr:hypothetical protein [Escherichia coli]